MQVEKTGSGQVGIMKTAEVSSLNRRDGFISFGLFNSCAPFGFSRPKHSGLFHPLVREWGLVHSPENGKMQRNYLGRKESCAYFSFASGN